ncbi:MAG: efflux RND transporter permease subunit [Myxococcota bacterium]
MNLTRRSLENPAYVAVGLAAMLIAGAISVFNLPVQLFPNIERPYVSVNAFWRGAAPQEVEAELLEPLEEVLQGTPGLEVMDAWANPNRANLGLLFDLETNPDRALLDLTSRINRLRSIPADAERPSINFSGGANDTLIYFFIQLLPTAEKSLVEFASMLDQDFAPRIEAIDGVAELDFQSGSPGDPQLRIEVDPVAAAAQGVPLTRLANALSGADNVSGGFVDVGRRRYSLRFRGKFSPEELRGLVVDWRDGAPVLLGDIADVGIELEKPWGFSFQNGRPAISVRVVREAGSNVLTTLNEVFEEVERAKVELLEPNGLTIEKSFDPSVFIWRAIFLLLANLVIGVGLAVGVLWLFVRRLRLTLLIASAIPVSLLTTFLVLKLFGRTFNVISLAGLAFAVGMVLDAAIVVMENTLRLREQGRPLLEAAYHGAKEVSGALVASTATTVAVFIPVLFTRNVEGQLFADLALTIAVAVAVSLVAALMILPLAASRFLTDADNTIVDEGQGNSRIVDAIMRATNGPKRRWVWIGGLVAGSATVVVLLAPAFDYLPPVRRDAVDVYLPFPDSSTPEYVRDNVAEAVVDRLAPYMAGEKEPSLLNYYLIIWPGGGTIGARVKKQGDQARLEEIMREEVLVGLPDLRQPNVGQGELFGNFGGGGSVIMYLQSRDRKALGRAAQLASDEISALYPEANPNISPRPEPTRPELTLFPNDRRILEVGLSRAEVGRLVRMLGTGLWLGEYFDGQSRLDVLLRGQEWEYPDDLMGIPIATPSGEIVPLGELATLERAVGPDAIRRVDGRRTISVSFDPPDGRALQDTLDELREKIDPLVRAELPEDGVLVYGGSASDLRRALKSTGRNAIIALSVLFLLTAGLFRSVRDAAIVTVSLPLAAAGGILALAILNLFSFQPLDLLTLIGFIILLGLVVNNAILLVARTREAEAEGMSRQNAVRSALQTRLRPILMSTSTSLLGMLPLVLAPGAGSAIYRGMATAIVGGLAVSTVFTLVLLPALLGLGKARVQRPENRLSGAVASAP